jgi:hypothetical protein
MTRSIDDIFPLDAGTVVLTVSVTSNRVALPGAHQTVRIANPGSVPVFLRAGDSSVTASVGHMFIAAGGGGLFSRNPDRVTHLAGISQASIVGLNIALGEGRYN